MSYEAWRREVAAGTMADWNEERGCYDPEPERSREITVRLWDKWMKHWVIHHGYVRHDEIGPKGRYSRTEEQA